MTSATLATVGQASRLSQIKREKSETAATAVLRTRKPSSPIVEPLPFVPFDVNAPIAKAGRHVPHWRQEGATYFITFRLADSIPKDKLIQWAKSSCATGCVEILNHGRRSRIWNTLNCSPNGFIAGWTTVSVECGCGGPRFPQSLRKHCDFSTNNAIGWAISR